MAGSTSIKSDTGYSRKEQVGWYIYDWANSAYFSTVVTLFFGPYITAVAKSAANADGYVHPLGIAVDARSYWGYLVSFSVLTQVLFLPVFGAVADASARKKRLLGLLAYTGATATVLMYFIEGQKYLLGGWLFLVANLAGGASVAIYNSFLPDIAPEKDRDRVSSKGWGIGYLGGGLLLVLNLLLYQQADALGLTEAAAVRLSLLSACVWWAAFSVIPLLWLRNRRPTQQGGVQLGSAVRQLFRTLRSLRAYPQTLVFLVAYLLYNDAIQAVITLSGQFGSDELKIPMSTLTMAILMVQFVAVGGAFTFNWLAARMTAKGAVILGLLIWIAVILAIFGLVKTTAHFFVAAAAVALVMGGTQALSRSLFSLMIPSGKEAEYFSLYEITDKGTSWLAPLLFGLALQFTKSYRLAILSLLAFFVLGLAVLTRVDVRRAAREAGNEAP